MERSVIRESRIPLPPSLHASADRKARRSSSVDGSLHAGYGLRTGLVVDFASLPNRNNQNNEAFVLNGCHDSVITDPVAPQSLEFAQERVAKASGVLSRGDPISQISQNESLGFMAEFSQVSGCIAVEFHAPDSLLGHRLGSGNSSRSSDSRLTRAAFRPSRLRAKW